jgi:pyridinium-3,5-biscarboxylic acid mononucleotide synthase
VLYARLIAVPTSVGYGANLQGFSALLTMLNSCTSGVTVVNIDNGFSAAVTATLINRKIEQYAMLSSDAIDTS